MLKNIYKTTNSGLNAPILKKTIMIQQTQKNPVLNSSIKDVKRSKPKQQPNVTVKREAKPAKLPAIAKKTPTKNSKCNPSAPTLNSSRPQVVSSTVINPSPPPKLLKSIIVHTHLPVIKDHITKENLTKKATFRCKSPRPESAVSRSTSFVATDSQEQIKTHHPLQRMDVGSLLSESARKRLKRLFNKLDTDKDGHLLYSQVQRCLPSNLPRAQTTFFRVLYDIISDTTYFGLQEFYATAIILEMVAKQDSTLWTTFLDDVDFNHYHNNILDLLEDFNNQCLFDIGLINYQNLLEIIMKRTTHGKIERIANEMEYVIPNIQRMKINRLEFIALLPAIIYIESCVDHGRTLFRFRENSLLDLHMRQALLT